MSLETLSCLLTPRQTDTLKTIPNFAIAAGNYLGLYILWGYDVYLYHFHAKFCVCGIVTKLPAFAYIQRIWYTYLCAFYRATRMHSANYAVASVCPSIRFSVCLSHAGIIIIIIIITDLYSAFRSEDTESELLYIYSNFFHHWFSPLFS